MAKIVRYRYIGFDCAGVIRAESEAEALAQTAEHAQRVHGLTEIAEDLVEAASTRMSDE